MSDIKYFKVTEDEELAGLFQSDSSEMVALEMVRLKMNNPELKIDEIDGDEYYKLLDWVMPEEQSW